MCLNHPQVILPHPGLWENCLPRNPSLVPKRLGMTATKSAVMHDFCCLFFTSSKPKEDNALMA